MAIPFFGSKGAQWSVGVDVGADCVKLIVLAQKGKGHELMAHGLFKRTDEQTIHKALRHDSVRKSDVRASIQDPKMKIRKVNVPEVPKEELEAILQWALKEAIKAPVDDYVIRSAALTRSANEKDVPYLLFGIERKLLQERIVLLKSLGIARPHVIEPHIQALAICIARNLSLRPTDRYALIDFGKTMTVFGVVSSDSLLFYRPFSGISGDRLTAQISLDLACNLEEAEKLKAGKEESISPELHAKWAETLNHFFTKLSVEIQYSKESYSAQFSGMPITHILLTGGGARLRGLAQHVEETLQAPATYLNPFKSIDTTRFQSGVLEDAQTYFGVAVGLAI